MSKPFNCVEIERLWTRDRGVLLGPVIGRGASRQAYACSVYPDLVVKIQHNPKLQNNFSEWRFSNIAPPQWQCYIAPVIWISNNGEAILQARTRQLTHREVIDSLAEIPDIFDDPQIANIGLNDVGAIVVHDYPNALANAARHSLEGRVIAMRPLSSWLRNS